MDARITTARSFLGRKPQKCLQYLQTNFEKVIAEYGINILDFGCGFGHLEKPLNRLGFQYTGTDLKRRPGIESYLPLEKLSRDHYDTVILSNVLNVQENDRQLEELLGKVIQVVKNQGLIIWNFPRSPRKGPWKTNISMISAFNRKMSLLCKSTTKDGHTVYLTTVCK